MHGSLVPAYGRDYTSKKAALADWNAGKDFDLRTFNGQGYINRQQAEESNLLSFQLRWKQLTQVTVIKFNPKKGLWV